MWNKQQGQLNDSFDLSTLPKTIIQIMAEIDSNTLVFHTSNLNNPLKTYISSEDIANSPTASGFTFPSANIAYLWRILPALTTGSPASKPSGSLPPGEVRPRHMILAPERTNLIAPLSTWTDFIMSGARVWSFKQSESTSQQNFHCWQIRTSMVRIENWFLIHNN